MRILHFLRVSRISQYLASSPDKLMTIKQKTSRAKLSMADLLKMQKVMSWKKNYQFSDLIVVINFFL